MLLHWLDVRLARLGLLVAIIAITVLALMPVKELPPGSGWDKLDHWFAFFVLSLLANHAFPRQRFWGAIALSLLAYGIGIEIAQAFTSDRSADFLDVAADGIGILIYGAALQLHLLFVKPLSE